MPFRFWEIALGCVAYFLNSNNRLINNNLKNISSSLSILIILLLMLLPLKQPVFLTMAIVFLSSILVLSIIKNSILYRILTHKNIIYIGKISYSLYLWHWGVISISSWTVGLNIPWLYLQILILILISHYSFKYIEQKSTNFLLNFSRANIFILGFFVLLISWCFSNIVELNRKILFLGNINTGNSIIGEKELYDYNNCFAERYSIKNSDKKDFNNCWMLKRENGQFISKEKRKFFSYGNSFNEHLTPLYAEIVQKVDNFSFNSFFSRGCISSSKIQFSTEIEKGVCNKIFKNYLNFFILNSDKGDSLIISSSYNYFSEKLNDFKVFVNKVDEISEAEALNIWIEELNHIGELLYREGKYLYVISTTPSIKGLPYISVNWYAKLNKECNKAGDKIINKEKDRINYLLENKLKSNNIIFVNIFESVKDLIPKNDLYEFFYNQDHLSIKGARYLLPQFLEVIKKNENFY